MLGLSKHQRKREEAKISIWQCTTKQIKTVSSSYRWGLSRTGCDWTRLHIIKEKGRG